MKKIVLTSLSILLITTTFSQNSSEIIKKPLIVNRVEVKKDLDEMITNISKYYSYLDDREVDLNCIRNHYSNQIETLKTEEDIALMFEFLLMEFYDNHMSLGINNNNSYRLTAPIYVTYKKNKISISNVWQSQIEKLSYAIIDAEVLEMNGVSFQKAIKDFLTKCTNKSSIEAKEWIANKIIFGTYNKSRILTLKLKDNRIVKLDIDKIKVKKTSTALDVEIQDNIGIVRINNSLGNNNLVIEFDKVLDTLLNTTGLILDLRNTPSGGNSYVAKGIMGRFIAQDSPYQKHLFIEKYDGNPAIKRTWIEFVSPRGKQYKKPVKVLVGKWTGSMGEGIAIGFDGMQRAEIVGSEMKKLLGAVSSFRFKNLSYGYNFPTQKLFHINNTPRENFVPKTQIRQITNDKDETLEEAISLLLKNKS